jgi:ATP-dependent RNA helicase DeaD
VTGKTGVSISIITPEFEDRISQIERKNKAKFTKHPLPTGMEVCEQQLYQIIRGIHSQEVQYAEIEPFMPWIMEELKDLTKEELIKRFASVEFNRFLSYYKNAPDIDIRPKGERRRGEETTTSGQMIRLFLNVGEMDGINKKDFIKFLSRSFGVPGGSIGQIDLNKAYMHFDIDNAYVNAVRQGLQEFTINGRRVRVDDASAQKDKKPRYEDAGIRQVGEEGEKEETLLKFSRRVKRAASFSRMMQPVSFGKSVCTEDYFRLSSSSWLPGVNLLLLFWPPR